MCRFHSFLLLKVWEHEAKVNRQVKGRSCWVDVEAVGAEALVGEDEDGGRALESLLQDY
jgi:hypothetical protein